MENNSIMQAANLFNAGDKQKASEILISFLKENPRNVEAWYGLSVCMENIASKRLCLLKVLEIDPNRTKARQALEELNRVEQENRTTLDSLRNQSVIVENTNGIKNAQLTINQNLKSGTVQFIPANCPNCGGELRVPDNKHVVKCMYCGHDVIIHDPTRITVDTYFDVEKFLELARDAQEGNNFVEAYKYYTQVLEHDLENIEAWLGKGYAAGMLSTFENPRIDEAMNCIGTKVMSGLQKKQGKDDKDIRKKASEYYWKIAGRICSLEEEADTQKYSQMEIIKKETDYRYRSLYFYGLACEWWNESPRRRKDEIAVMRAEFKVILSSSRFLYFNNPKGYEIAKNHLKDCLYFFPPDIQNDPGIRQLLGL